MVNLPLFEFDPIVDQPYRFGSRRIRVSRPLTKDMQLAIQGPITMKDLELLATRELQKMVQIGQEPGKDEREKVLAKLRSKHNMRFLMYCDICKKCNGRHGQDELLAPER